MAQPSLLYLSECPPWHLLFSHSVGNKDTLRVGRVEGENLRGVLWEVCSYLEGGLPSSPDWGVRWDQYLLCLSCPLALGLDICFSKLLLCLGLRTFLKIFIYFWLHWVFVAARGLPIVAASGCCSLWRWTGFSLRWLLLLRSTGSRCAGFSGCGTRALERRLRSCGVKVCGPSESEFSFLQVESGILYLMVFLFSYGCLRNLESAFNISVGWEGEWML